MGLGGGSGAWLQLGQAKNVCYTPPPSARSRQDLGAPVSGSPAIIPPSGLPRSRWTERCSLPCSSCPLFVLHRRLYYFYMLLFPFFFLISKLLVCVNRLTVSSGLTHLCPYPHSECLVSVNKLNFIELCQICGLRVYGIQYLFWTWLFVS